MQCGHYRRLGDPLPFLPHLYVSPPLAPSLPLPCSSTSTYYIVFLLSRLIPNLLLPSSFPVSFFEKCLVKYTLGAFPNISQSLRTQPWKQKTETETSNTGKIYTVVLVLIVVYGQWSMSLRFPCPLLS